MPANQQLVPGFLGDLTLLAGWNVTPNFALQVGYDFLWVAGIATATRQFNLDNVRQDSARRRRPDLLQRPLVRLQRLVVSLAWLAGVKVPRRRRHSAATATATAWPVEQKFTATAVPGRPASGSPWTTFTGHAGSGVS